MSCAAMACHMSREGLVRAFHLQFDPIVPDNMIVVTYVSVRFESGRPIKSYIFDRIG